MTARVEDVRAARDVVASADIQPIEDLRAACETLITFGDWIDVSRAMELRRQLERELAAADLRQARLARQRGLRRVLAVCGAALIAALVVFSTGVG